tara:strand:+ start:430 stop:546 length:117 start_codon:yes stop_codon:yes gene_type:complete
MLELIAQIFGMAFICVILVCLVFTVGDIIIENQKRKKL